MSHPILQEMSVLAEEKQLLELQLQIRNLQAAKKAFNKNSKRRSPRLVNKQSLKKRKIQPTSEVRDSIKIPDLNGTLGSQVRRLGSAIDLKESKSRYFSCLCKNGIVDSTNFTKGSQMALLNISRKSKLITKTLADGDNADTVDFDSTFSTTKVENWKDAKKKMAYLEHYHPTNMLNRKIRNTVLYILDQHAYNPSILSDNYLKKCSEQSLIVKFWSYAFEQLLGSMSNVFLQWGDTLSSQDKEIGTVCRLDLRVIIYNQMADIEASTGEFAKYNTTTKSKLYGDRLKSVLASKAHLNHLLSSMKSISRNDVKTIKIPVIQVMGLSCYVYSLCLIDERLYCLQNVCEFVYPRNFHQLRNGDLDKLIGSLLKVREMVSDVDCAMENYNRNTSNNMKNILEEKKKSPTSSINLSHWITQVNHTGNLSGSSKFGEDENDDDDFSSDDDNGGPSGSNSSNSNGNDEDDDDDNDDGGDNAGPSGSNSSNKNGDDDDNDNDDWDENSNGDNNNDENDDKDYDDA